MNYRLILYLLGIVALFIGVSMAIALPWALPVFGGVWETESDGFFGLMLSMTISFALGLLLWYQGRHIDKQLLRKESMAVVPLSWILAIALGALPYLIGGTERAPGVPMSIFDAVFESTSGFTTTGATVISDVENREMVSRAILFWRATTHFLGGLGIMVLFVVIFGQGVTGKTIMKIEKGSGSAGPQGRMRQTAWTLAGVYIGLIAVETVLLIACGLSIFDALCHSFSTMASGGFSTYNASVGHFAANTGLAAWLIESIIIIFMILAGSNFVLIFYCFTGQPKKLWEDPEWRVFLGVILAASAIIFFSGLVEHDFDSFGTADSAIASGGSLRWTHAFRQSVFQTVSFLTSTGFCTDEYEKWNSISLLIFLLLMFLGGCAGGTAGGTKIIRSLVAFQSVRQEGERTYRPDVIRILKIGGTTVDKSSQQTIITFLLLFFVSVFVVAFFVLLIEPDAPWTNAQLGKEEKMIDIFSSSLSMHSNVGPGFGLIGARQNCGFFSPATKTLYSWSMLLGRLELLPLLLFSPGFWRKN